MKECAFFIVARLRSSLYFDLHHHRGWLRNHRLGNRTFSSENAEMKKWHTPTVLFVCLIFFLPACDREMSGISEGQSNHLLVLITDFDKESDAVLRFIGRIHLDFPDVQVEYLQARPFSIKESAYLVQVAVESYPPGTFFTGIVEPGASGPRMIFDSAGRTVLLPDNGLASRILHAGAAGVLYKVENPAVLAGGEADSMTFDQFYTEATCSMLRGVPLSQFGPVLADPVVWEIQDPVRKGDVVSGEILFSDNFGNCVTNIDASLMTGFVPQSLLRVSTGVDSFFTTLGLYYSSVPCGENVAFINVSKRLEISVNEASLVQRYAIGAGTPVRLDPGVARIGILRYNNSTISEAIVAGMKTRLEELGFKQGVNIEILERNAMGDRSLLPALLQELLAAGIDILVPVSTPASQAAVQMAPPSIPIVFTYVTDPASAGILNKRAKVTGLSDATNYSQYMQFFKHLFPMMPVVGRIYSENESNAVYAQDQLVAQSPNFGITFQSATVAGVEGVPTAYQQIRAQGIGAIVICDDNTMSLAMPALVGLAMADHLPVVGEANDHVRAGALASITVDMEMLAEKTAEVAVSVLRGVDPDGLEVMRFNTDVIAVNRQTAALLNYTFPADILTSARYVFP